jgi:hypothetical protein
MGELIRKHKSGENGIKIHQAHEIASWFEMAELPESVKRPFTVIKEHIMIPKGT